MLRATGNRSLARLCLRAVLPTFAAFVESDEAARRTVEGWRFTVRFASTGGAATTLAFRDGAVEVDPPAAGFALRLLFLSDRDVVRAFRREGTPRVLPWGGLHHLMRLPAFIRLLADMEGVLNPPAGGAARSGRQELRLDLLLGTLLPAAGAELGAHDGECRRLLAPFGDFVAQLSVPRVAGGWVARRGGRMAWGRGRAPAAPDVWIEFRDPDVAQAAIDARIDPLAAIVAGEISVRGMIPLADVFTLIMERVSACLDPKRS